MQGLQLVQEYISLEEEIELISNINKSSEVLEGKERNSIQRFGRFRSTIPGVDPEIPSFLINLSEKVMLSGYLDKMPDAIAINEYFPGQGIEPHVDSLSNGPIITILSLGGAVVMDFERNNHNSFQLYFPGRSLLQMSGSVRYDWAHSIKARMFDMVSGEKVARTTRYSIVFRHSCFT